MSARPDPRPLALPREASPPLAPRLLGRPKTMLERMVAGALVASKRTPCTTCGETGWYRGVLSDDRASANVRRYACEHGHWLFLVKGGLEQLPRAIRRRREGIEPYAG